MSFEVVLFQEPKVTQEGRFREVKEAERLKMKAVTLVTSEESMHFSKRSFKMCISSIGDKGPFIAISLITVIP